MPPRGRCLLWSSALGATALLQQALPATVSWEPGAPLGPSGDPTDSLDDVALEMLEMVPSASPRPATPPQSPPSLRAPRARPLEAARRGSFVDAWSDDRPPPGTCPREASKAFFTPGRCSEFSSPATCASRRSAQTWLASFPCSGNTWLRVILESTTSIYTGSMYYDEDLIAAGLRGEGYSSPSKVLGTKTHMPLYSPHHEVACANCRAVVLLRHPLDTALSYVQYKAGGRSHDLEVGATELRAAFTQDRDKSLEEWRSHYDFWKEFPGPKLIVRYEDLKADPFNVFMHKILPFLGIDTLRPNVQRRLRCAIDLSNRKAGIRRNHTYHFGWMHEDRSGAEKILGAAARSVGYHVTAGGEAAALRRVSGARVSVCAKAGGR
eukprot:CAMPEP_0168392112 /NCGR_PEP_ID=MMETSP0228-20121227/18331_1 /TAXON_ID=133427 /ORGANISM="Protoceratium reticulatum, Strain CCCM 535 (=CCMP 1889)" /LENGTH=379 /DNA_ID=CAMNT_0008405445 /DNA_START=1 /DNA_END=1137 /DNA_ORIENTATION=+